MRIIAVAAFTAAALATAAPGAAQVVNGGFELGIGGTSSLTGYNGYGQSTATAWSTHNNSAGTTTTTRARTRRPMTEDSYWMHAYVAWTSGAGFSGSRPLAFW